MDQNNLPMSDPVPYRDTYKKGVISIQMDQIDTNLFPTVKHFPRKKKKEMDSTMLVTGFDLRNAESLEELLRKEKMLAKQLAKEQRLRLTELEAAEEECHYNKQDEFSPRLIESPSHSTVTTSTTTVSLVETESSQKMLHYLLGLPDVVEENVPIVQEFLEEVPSIIPNLAVKQAYEYLRSHRIFEFFQFIISHMLSASPNNPIAFILDLLDKCLVYRTGIGPPPLLYEKCHLEQLFFLMDRMKTGFIEIEQYKTGMKTLGICGYKEFPPLSAEGFVSKDFFIQEAHDCLVALLFEMIRARREMGAYMPSVVTPPPTKGSSYQRVEDYIVTLDKEAFLEGG